MQHLQANAFSQTEMCCFCVVHHPDLEKVFECKCEFFFRETVIIALYINFIIFHHLRSNPEVLAFNRSIYSGFHWLWIRRWKGVPSLIIQWELVEFVSRVKQILICCVNLLHGLLNIWTKPWNCCTRFWLNMQVTLANQLWPQNPLKFHRLQILANLLNLISCLANQ